jgi:predicted alpha/beta-fold hydrolase
MSNRISTFIHPFERGGPQGHKYLGEVGSSGDHSCATSTWTEDAKHISHSMTSGWHQHFYEPNLLKCALERNNPRAQRLSSVSSFIISIINLSHLVKQIIESFLSQFQGALCENWAVNVRGSGSTTPNIREPA